MALRIITSGSSSPKEFHDKFVDLLKKDYEFPFNTDRLDVDDSGDITFGYEHNCYNRVWLRFYEDESSENMLVYGVIGPRDSKLTVYEYACIMSKVSSVLLDRFSTYIEEIKIVNCEEVGVDSWS